MGHPVFVYGSLMRGLGNHEVLGPSVGDGTAGTLMAVDLEMVSLGAFPALVQRARAHADANNAPKICGELYEVSDDTLRDLDMLEGHPRFYRRRLLPVYDRVHTCIVDAWVYAMGRTARDHEVKVEVTHRMVGGRGGLVSWRRHLSDRDCGLSQRGGA